MPQFEAFNRTKKPLDDLETYKGMVHIYAVPGEILITLKRSARMSFNKLNPSPRGSFVEVSKLIASHFIGERR